MRLVAVLLLVLSPVTLYADPSEDEIGFGDDAGFADLPSEPTPTAPPPTSPLSLTGLIRSDQGLWLERFSAAPGPPLPGGNDNPFAKSRQSLDLTLDWKKGPVSARVAGHGEFDLAYLVNADRYDAATKEVYRELLQLREVWLNASLGAFEVHFGRQIVAWGEGDGASVVDVVNPRDLREPGLSDLEDIRVAVLATRVGWFHTTDTGDHRVELIVVHETCNGLWAENCFGLRTPPMGPFSPLPAFFGDQGGGQLNLQGLLEGKQLRFTHDRDQLAWANQQPMLRWSYNGAGVDLGLYAASVLDQQGVLGALDPVSLLDADVREVAIPLQHRRYQLFGTSGALTTGDFLLKWELAYGRSKPFNVQGAGPLPTIALSDTVEALGSVTWRGLSNTVIGLEVTKLWLLDDPGPLLFPADAVTWSLRVNHDAMRERLHVSAVAVGFGLQAQYGWLARADVRYDVVDALSVGLAYVHYEPGEEFGPLSGFDYHDRVAVQLRYAFSVL